MYNRLLLNGIQHSAYLYAILYSTSESPPTQDGILWKWQVGRTASIGYLFAAVQKKKLRLPRLEDSGPFIDEFVCEVAEYDEINRTVKYTHPATQPDDILHACNYALIMAVNGFPSNARPPDYMYE
jgi:hypothetical protein